MRSMCGFWRRVAMAVVFGYFCVSSFVKASRRSRQTLADSRR